MREGVSYYKSKEQNKLQTNTVWLTNDDLHFKALALTATLAAGTIFGAVAPANAGDLLVRASKVTLVASAATYCLSNQPSHQC